MPRVIMGRLDVQPKNAAFAPKVAVLGPSDVADPSAGNDFMLLIETQDGRWFVPIREIITATHTIPADPYEYFSDPAGQ